MEPLVLSPDDLNADWVKVVPDKDGRPYRESELELQDRLSFVITEKHLPGRHDQQRHAPRSVLTRTNAAEQAWADSLTSDELDAINGYMNIGPAWKGSAATNDALRSGELNAEERKHVELIDSAIDKAPRTTGITAFYRSLPPNAHVSDGAYVSAFKNPPSESVYSSGGRQLRKFTVSEDTPVAPVSSLHTPFSEEVLLPRDVVVLSEEVYD